MSKLCSADKAVNHINSNQRVFVHGGTATPIALVDALVEEAHRLHNVELIHLHTSGDASYAKPEYARSFRVANLFVGHNMRHQLDGDRVDYLPCFLSEIPQLFRSGRRALDIALVQVSPPDRRGYCSLGVSVDVARAAVDSAKVVIAQVNRHMPRVHGDGFVHIDQLDWLVEHDEPLPEVAPSPPSEEEQAIGHHAAELIEDGATLQMGIGAVPDAVLSALKGHRHLGVHTEMWSDGLLPLLECGAVDNSQKVVHPGRTVSGFIVGTRRVYDYIDDNRTGLRRFHRPSGDLRSRRTNGFHSWGDDLRRRQADYRADEPYLERCPPNRANAEARCRRRDDPGTCSLHHYRKRHRRPLWENTQ